MEIYVNNIFRNLESNKDFLFIEEDPRFYESEFDYVKKIFK